MAPEMGGSQPLAKGVETEVELSVNRTLLTVHLVRFMVIPWQEVTPGASPGQ